MEDAVKRAKPIVVEFDPDFMLASMDLWRKSLDMQMPIADEVKIHFMKNRASCWRVSRRRARLGGSSCET
ncbi:hypothetical protein [Paraburkholderia terrae]|uniref:hypothetical protein n=1 Tax=Paraburkholderia terrae TaxID=311230 RepID=UPI000AF94CBF|nr:hypothetical protein [Paraburkholderia terrae]